MATKKHNLQKLVFKPANHKLVDVLMSSKNWLRTSAVQVHKPPLCKSYTPKCLPISENQIMEHTLRMALLNRSWSISKGSLSSMVWKPGWPTGDYSGSAGRCHESQKTQTILPSLLKTHTLQDPSIKMEQKKSDQRQSKQPHKKH